MKNMLTSGMAAIAMMSLSCAATAQDGGDDQQEEARNSDGGRSTARGHSKEAFLNSYDTNEDGTVSSEEFMARRAETYETFDLNGDGMVAEDEYVDEYKFRLDQQLAEQRARQIRQAHVRYGVLDTDENANMTLDEFNESGSRMFSRLDSNEDGVVDQRDTAEHF
ncbi:hypothetical protein [Alteraurantiacibacter aquimixticola]|uniref:EF-hand domain-containing protein n=1 Tax=Alteraurantiacibacter aquimixticola TaxID=2489173 RepID=A0A4T3F5M8_9SPHN|nr:hypothetical protein [Alteraurantiacibacter aquimixticola]TIX51694.1 hypothetical protein E5222_04385 [Alteraurantiacibacter aquimixticola]